jgi:carnitine O-acetyltransferase
MYLSTAYSTSNPPPWKVWRFPPTLPKPSPEDQTPLLPSLPVPPLDQTIAKLRKSLLAIPKTKEQEQAAEKKIQEFVSSGWAEKLHNRLLERKKSLEVEEGKGGNWLAEWWDEYAYMVGQLLFTAGTSF